MTLQIRSQSHYPLTVWFDLTFFKLWDSIAWRWYKKLLPTSSHSYTGQHNNPASMCPGSLRSGQWFGAVSWDKHAGRAIRPCMMWSILYRATCPIVSSGVVAFGFFTHKPGRWGPAGLQVSVQYFLLCSYQEHLAKEVRHKLHFLPSMKRAKSCTELRDRT